MDKRRVFTPGFKLQVVLEVLSGQQEQRGGLPRAPTGAGGGDGVERAVRASALGIFAWRKGNPTEQRRIAELERLVGRQALEIEVLKKASSILTSLSPRSGR